MKAVMLNQYLVYLSVSVYCLYKVNSSHNECKSGLRPRLQNNQVLRAPQHTEVYYQYNMHISMHRWCLSHCKKKKRNTLTPKLKFSQNKIMSFLLRMCSSHICLQMSLFFLHFFNAEYKQANNKLARTE